MEREIITNDWITLHIILSISLLCFSRLLNRNKFDSLLSPIKKFDITTSLMIEHTKNDALSYLLDFNFIFNFALLTSVIKNYKYNINFNFLTAFETLIIVGGFFILKRSLSRTTDYLLEIKPITNNYQNIKDIFFKLSGILITPAILFYIYPQTSKKIFVSILLISLFTLVIIFAKSIIKTMLNIKMNYVLYIFLYLCILELSPLVILYNILIE